MSSQPIRVLFVDDNRLMAQALERRLGFETSMQYAGWVESAADAVRVAQESRADVVMLDVDMPGDSFDLVRQLNEAAPRVKVVMFSGYSRAEYVDHAVDVGAWGYISKNESIDVIIDAICRVAAGEFVLSPDVESARGPGSG